MEDCEHELVFQKVVNDCWFVHLCKRCDQVVLSNRVEGVIEDELETEEEGLNAEDWRSLLERI